MLQLLPSYVKLILIGLFLISSLAALLRRNLYFQLREDAKRVSKFRERTIINGNDTLNKPSIIEGIETRFILASQQLDRVNTAALLDGIYGEKTLKFIGLALPYEQWHSITRSLPNLLISIGLLGTFLGITLNLSSLGDIITNLDSNNLIDSSDLIDRIQIPLTNMGIAFTSSLVAVFSNFILLLVNLRYDTELAKNQLIASLEDYLDNLLHPTVEGHSRLDKAVNRMVEQQNEFLTRFHEKVGQVLESTLGKSAREIALENKIANQLAKEVYFRLLESTGSLSSSASIFAKSVSSLKVETQNLNIVSNNFQKSSDIIRESAILFSKSAEKIEASKFSARLEQLTSDLATTQTDFAKSTHILGECFSEIVARNKQSDRLAERIYTHLETSTKSLQASAETFQAASESIDRSHFVSRFASTTAELANTQKQFSQSTSVLEKSTHTIDSTIKTLQCSLEKSFFLGDRHLHSLDDQSNQLISISQNNSQSLNNIATLLTKEVENVSLLQSSIQEILQLLKKAEA